MMSGTAVDELMVKYLHFAYMTVVITKAVKIIVYLITRYVKRIVPVK